MDNSANNSNSGESQLSSQCLNISDKDDFVNHAEIAWQSLRREWVGDQSNKPQQPPKEPIMSWSTSYDDLLISTEPFQQPIPLAEMVDFLVDIWLEDGLYD